MAGNHRAAIYVKWDLGVPDGSGSSSVCVIYTNGYILLHRQLLENPIWTQMPAEHFKVWIGILMRANYKPSKWWDGSTQIDIPAGAFICSLDTLAQFCHVSISQVRSTIKYLEMTHAIARRTTHRHTLLTVTNWSIYQSAAEDDRTLSDTLSSTHIAQSSHAHRTHVATEEEYKNIRKKESNITKALATPSEKPRKATEAERNKWFVEKFWPIVWHKVAVGAARKAWIQKVDTPEMCESIIQAAMLQGPGIVQRGRQPGSAILHPATWLNQERYLDEVEPAGNVIRFDSRDAVKEAWIQRKERERGEI
jgi:hypothetical protein